MPRKKAADVVDASTAPVPLAHSYGTRARGFIPGGAQRLTTPTRPRRVTRARAVVPAVVPAAAVQSQNQDQQNEAENEAEPQAQATAQNQENEVDEAEENPSAEPHNWDDAAANAQKSMTSILPSTPHGAVSHSPGFTPLNNTFRQTLDSSSSSNRYQTPSNHAALRQSLTPQRSAIVQESTPLQKTPRNPTPQQIADISRSTPHLTTSTSNSPKSTTPSSSFVDHLRQRSAREARERAIAKKAAEECEEDSEDEEYSFLEGSAYTADAIRRNYSTPKSGSKTAQIKAALNIAMEKQDKPSKEGSSTIDSTSNSLPASYVLIARPGQEEHLLTDIKILDATSSLITWAERDATRAVPNAEEMEQLLVQFDAQRKAEMTLSQFEEATNDYDTEQTQMLPGTPQRAATDSYDMSMIDGEQAQTLLETPQHVVADYDDSYMADSEQEDAYLSDASEAHIETPTPHTPVPATPQRQEAGGFWLGLSAVKSIVATPFAFFGRRTENIAATNGTPVPQTAQNTRSVRFAPNLQFAPTPPVQTPSTSSQTPRARDSHASPLSTPTPMTATRGDEEDIYRLTNDLFAAADAHDASQQQGTPSTQRPRPATLTQILQPTPTRPTSRRAPTPARPRTQTQQGPIRLTPVPTISRSELARQKRQATPLHSRGMLTREEILERQQEQDRRRDRELNENRLSETDDTISSMKSGARPGDKRKSAHKEEVLPPQFSDAGDAEVQMGHGRRVGREINEAQLEDDDEPMSQPLINGPQTGGKRKTPHKDNTVMATNSFTVPDSSSDEETDDSDSPEEVQDAQDAQQVEERPGPSTWINPLFNNSLAAKDHNRKIDWSKVENQGVPPYTGSVARLPDSMQQDIDNRSGRPATIAPIVPAATFGSDLTPPPKPRPANAQLPLPKPAFTPTVKQTPLNPTNNAAEIRAKAKLDAHKPKTPSTLREVSTMSPLVENKENRGFMWKFSEAEMELEKKLFSEEVRMDLNKVSKEIYKEHGERIYFPEISKASVTIFEDGVEEEVNQWFG